MEKKKMGRYGFMRQNCHEIDAFYFTTPIRVINMAKFV